MILHYIDRISSCYLIDIVQNREDRMRENHTRSGIAHYPADFFSHIRSVTMDGAFGASGFIILIGTPVDALHGVVIKLLAICA